MKKFVPSLAVIADAGRDVQAPVFAPIASRKNSFFFWVLLLVAFSNVQAQVSPPLATDVSPTVNTEVSSMIQTGCGYDAWTGSVHRSVTDLEVPGAVSSLGLKWVRTYNSGGNSGVLGWSFSWTWRYWGRGWGGDATAVHLPDGGIWRTTEPGMKLRWNESCPSCGNGSCVSCVLGDAYLYLEDGSTVHMDVYRDPPEPDQTPPRLNWIDDYTPTYVDDPYGRRTTLDYEEACVFGYDDDGATKRLKQVTDPSGRYIRITYAYDAGDCQHNTTSNWWKPLRVEGSDGSWVNYTWDQSNAGYLTHVDYSDGTHADYTYGNTTYNWDTVCCDQNGNNCHNCTIPGNATKLIAAWDTHADSPMQSIDYEYKAPGSFEGQIRAEHRLVSATPTASPSAGVAVSTFTSTSCPTHPWSQSPDCPNATQTEARGDGPSRTIYMEQAAQHVPLVKHKSDFNGINEIFTYDSNNYLLTAKNRNGNLTTYTNEPLIGNPTQILHPDGTHIDYTYSDPNNPYHIATVADERGKTTSYTRDTNNRITEIDYPADASTPASYETFTYNGWGQVLTHRRKNGAYEHAVYSGGLLVKLFNPTATASYPPSDTEPHIILSYYPAGNAWQDRVQTVTYPATGIGQVPVETYEYDRALGTDGLTNLSGTALHGRGLVTKITHADGKYQQFRYDAYGNKREEYNELPKLTSYTYDGYKRLLTVTDPLNKTTTYTYNSTNGGSSFLHTTSNPDTITTPTGIVTKNSYDANFRKTSSTAAYGTTVAATTSFLYDNVGNLTQVTDPRSKVALNTYDTRNRKTSTTEAYGTSLAQPTTWHYDAASNIYQIDRPDGTHETKTYDALNRVLTDTVPQTSSINLTTTFAYNPSGTIASVTDANNHTTTFAYDASDQKITMTYPNNGGTQTWAYDGVHNLKWRITVNNEAKYFYYDSRNRLYTTWWSNWANNIVDWRYFGYDAASRLIEAENGTGGFGANVISDVHRSYDDANHLTLEQQNVIGLGTISVNYPTYNDDGKLTSMNVTGVPDYNYTFSYDAMGRFEKIFITNSSQLFQYYYDAACNEIERDNLNNGVNQIYPRDDLNRMLNLDVKKGTTTLGHEGYVYDAMSRLKSVTREDNKTDSFTYYLDGELNTAQYGTTRSVNYTLDKAGNRTTVTDNVNGNATYTPNTLNQYTAVTGNSITNGPEHEISGFDGVNYSYINDERLSTVTSGSSTYNLVYDALGRCVKRTLYTPQQDSDRQTPTPRPTLTPPPTPTAFPSSTPTPTPNATPTPSPSPQPGVSTYYLYDGEKPILEVDGNTGSEVGVNVYGKGIDEILERGAYGTDNVWHWNFFQQDHEGSVTHLTDGSGNIIERYRYDAFGAPSIYALNWTVRSATIYDNRFLFTGREYAATYRATYNNQAFNFYEYRARAYHPGLGRFTNEDPKLFDAGDYNLFRYCHNDPLDLTDPMGTSELPGIKPPPDPPKKIQSPSNHTGGNFFSRLFQSVANLFGRRSSAEGADGIAAGRAGYAPIVRRGYLRIDADGSGPDHGEPSWTHSNQTAYQPHGRSLNADTDPYVAIPTALLKQGARLGDRAVLGVDGRSAPGVVGDTGADPRLVEASVRHVHDVGVRTRDIPGVGAVPITLGGREIRATMTIYPSRRPEP
jgi:RHS repeat-associated protein